MCLTNPPKQFPGPAEYGQTAPGSAAIFPSNPQPTTDAGVYTQQAQPQQPKAPISPVIPKPMPSPISKPVPMGSSVGATGGPLGQMPLNDFMALLMGRTQ